MSQVQLIEFGQQDTVVNVNKCFREVSIKDIHLVVFFVHEMGEFQVVRKGWSVYWKRWETNSISWIFYKRSKNLAIKSNLVMQRQFSLFDLAPFPHTLWREVLISGQ